MSDAGRPNSCYHCGLPAPQPSFFHLQIAGAQRDFCCPGCLAVASTIIDGGLESFYRFRSADAQKPQEDARFEAWDLPEVQADYVLLQSDGQASVLLAVQGITCAACTWLIEKHLSAVPGIAQVRVNGTTHRAEIKWHAGQIKLSDILRALAAIGYRCTPINEQSDMPEARDQMRKMLLRMGLAGLAMMQTGMVSIALYAGAFQGIEEQWERLLRLVSFILVTPVVLYSAQPFFIAAVRSLRVRQLVMDVPVSLAIALAYSASVWATWRGGGEVYYDSVAMFTFFLLLGRFFEQRIRYRNLLVLHGATNLLPPTAEVVRDGQRQQVPVKALLEGDRVIVYAGQTIPCDGVVVEGRSQVEEAVLTGEALPQEKSPGDSVSAGTLNGDNPLQIEVTALGARTRLSTILRLAQSVGMEKPHWVGVADRVSAWFVAAVILTAGSVGWYWWLHEPQQAFWIALSVLVVTCPCALSLATPTALSVATGVLRKKGFLINRGHVLETLAQTNSVVFDKTGTLTRGDLHLVQVVNHSGLPENDILAIAAALEQGGHHPIAAALQQYGGKRVQNQQFFTGCGVSAEIEGKRYLIGKSAWVADVLRTGAIPEVDRPGMQVALASEEQLLAVLVFDDLPRDSAAGALQVLRENGYAVALLSGDPSPQAGRVAEALGIDDAAFALSPEEKLARIHSRQQAGDVVLMVGDGINDVPVLQAADVSVAMGQASDVARINGDAILLAADLAVLPEALQLAQRTRRIVRQNVAWAIGYNGLALPLAAAGWVPPWAAAIGMSLSSLLVLVNALRLNRS